MLLLFLLAGASAALSPGGRCASALDCNATACANCACVNHTCTCNEGWSGPQCRLRLPSPPAVAPPPVLSFSASAPPPRSPWSPWHDFDWSPSSVRALIDWLGIFSLVLAASAAILRATVSTYGWTQLKACACPASHAQAAPAAEPMLDAVGVPMNVPTPALGSRKLDAKTAALLYEKSWREVQEILGWSRAQMMVSASFRVVFFHLSQPVLYAIFFYAGYDIIDSTQRSLGWVVAAREGIYLLFIVLATIWNPTWLFRDAVAGVGYGDVERIEALVLVLAPEKMAFVSAFRDGHVGNGKHKLWFLWLATGLLDMCPIAALLDGATNHTLYAPLAVGYGITALSVVGLCVVSSFLMLRDFFLFCVRIAGAIRSCLARLCK